VGHFPLAFPEEPGLPALREEEGDLEVRKCKDCGEDPSGPGWEVFVEYHDIERGRVVACYVAEVNEVLARIAKAKKK